MKEILKALWTLNFKGEDVNLPRLKDYLKRCGLEEVEKTLNEAIEQGLAVEDNGLISITKKGRKTIKVVVCGGVFDILHPGHAFILNEAKASGDILVVIVARDSTVEKRKRIPIVSESQRTEMVGQLKPVDVSMLGGEGDPFKIIEDIRPDLIALGPDQHHDEGKISDEMKKRGISLKVKRISEYKECNLNSTKAILQRIIERSYPGSKR
jgi:FAD synthetase